MPPGGEGGNAFLAVVAKKDPEWESLGEVSSSSRGAHGLQPRAMAPVVVWTAEARCKNWLSPCTGTALELHCCIPGLSSPQDNERNEQKTAFSPPFVSERCGIT